MVGAQSVSDSSTASVPYRKLEMEAGILERQVRQFMNLTEQLQGRDYYGLEEETTEIRAQEDEVQLKFNNLNQQLESCQRDEMNFARLQHVTATVCSFLDDELWGLFYCGVLT